MHYRNGRIAANGDKIVQLDDTGVVKAAGVLTGAAPGNDYCNGWISPITMQGAPSGDAVGACLCDCLHVEDLATLIVAAGLDKRPEGK